MKTALRCTIVAGVCALALAMGCASDKGMSESKGDVKVVAVNMNCAMKPGSPVDPAVHETYKGEVVGFCCGMCQSKFDKMTDAEKDAAVKKAKAAN